MRQHDWAAVIGANLETGDPPVAYCCQACGLQIPGQILLVSPDDGEWLAVWLAREENAAAEVHHVRIPRGAAYLADPRQMELRPCAEPAGAEPWSTSAWRRHEAVEEMVRLSSPIGKVKIA